MCFIFRSFIPVVLLIKHIPYVPLSEIAPLCIHQSNVCYYYPSIDVAYLIYCRPLYVLAVQISHHQVGYGYTRIAKGERLLISNSKYRVVIK